MLRSSRWVSFVACCAIAFPAFAQQEPPRPGNQPPGADPNNPGQQERQRRGGIALGRRMQVQDRDLAALLAIGNRAGIQMAELAKSKTQNPKVKEFAELMIQDHSALQAKLDGMTEGRRGGIGREINIRGGEETTQKGDQPRTDRPRGVEVKAPGVDIQVGERDKPGQEPGRRAFYPPGQNPYIQLAEDVAQECMTMAKQELGAKQGAEFDMCYMGTQIVKHHDMLAMLKVAERRAEDSQFKETLGSAIQTVESHIKQAESIISELSPAAAGSSARP